MVASDPKMQIKWALIASVPENEDMKQLNDFGEWFVHQLSTVGRKIGVYYDFEKKASFVEKVLPGDMDACIITYENLHKNCPSAHVVIHILPFPGSDEYQWMKSLTAQYGLIRQGVLLENAKAKFDTVEGGGSDVFKNVAQWISRSAYRLCNSKNASERQWDIRVGSGQPSMNKQYIPHIIQTAVNNVLHGQDVSICRDEVAVIVEGFPSRLNEFGVAQLFSELTITGVTLKGKSATVVFANKFQAYQAVEHYNNLAVDRRHTLKLSPQNDEVVNMLSQAAVADN